MFDIDKRMEQWTAANHAVYSEEANSFLQSSDPAPITKSASVASRARIYTDKQPGFDIDSRINAWNNNSVAYPFKKADEEPTEMVSLLMQEPPEALIELAEECINELESRGVTGDSGSDMPEGDEETEEKKDEGDKSPFE